jgi:hypothetical protein
MLQGTINVRLWTCINELTIYSILTHIYDYSYNLYTSPTPKHIESRLYVPGLQHTYLMKPLASSRVTKPLGIVSIWCFYASTLNDITTSTLIAGD